MDAHHPHFVLVPGAAWGEEAPWIARVGTELAGGWPSVTVLVNGGEISYTDVGCSLRAGGRCWPSPAPVGPLISWPAR